MPDDILRDGACEAIIERIREEIILLFDEWKNVLFEPRKLGMKQ